MVSIVLWAIVIAGLFYIVKRTVGRAYGEFTMYDENFGEVSVRDGRYCVFLDHGDKASEYCCVERNHRTLFEARDCWKRYEHFIENDPLLCERCGSNIDVSPETPCLQCVVNGWITC